MAGRLRGQQQQQQQGAFRLQLLRALLVHLSPTTPLRSENLQDGQDKQGVMSSGSRRLSSAAALRLPLEDRELGAKECFAGMRSNGRATRLSAPGEWERRQELS